MLFFVRFDVTQPNTVTNQDLVETWRREAAAARGALDAGVIKHLWKVAGQRVVLAVVGLPAAEDLDRALGGLPIIREMGSGVRVEALPVYDYTTYADDLDRGRPRPLIRGGGNAVRERDDEQERRFDGAFIARVGRPATCHAGATFRPRGPPVRRPRDHGGGGTRSEAEA